MNKNHPTRAVHTLLKNIYDYFLKNDEHG